MASSNETGYSLRRVLSHKVSRKARRPRVKVFGIIWFGHL